MPTYLVDFETASGPHRERFTIDADRALGVQVRRVLEDLRLRGVVLRGGHEDELEILWNGVVVDAHLSPEQLQLEPHRPLQLRMRRREALAVEVGVTLTSGGPRRPFVPLAAWQRGWAATAGALLAWIGMSFVHQYDRVVPDSLALDAAAAAAVCATAIVAGRLGPWSFARGSRWWLLLAAPVAAAAAASIALLAHDTAWGGFALRRAVLFASCGAVTALTLTLLLEVGRWASGAAASVLGALFGTVVSFLPSAPGAADAWLMLSWLALGFASGAASGFAALTGAVGVVEDVLDAPSLGLFLAARSTPVTLRGAAVVGDGPGMVDALAKMLDGDGVTLISRGEAVSSVRGSAAASYRAVNDEVVWLGGGRVRVRLLPAFWP